jgi:hypothetical protein
VESIKARKSWKYFSLSMTFSSFFLFDMFCGIGEHFLSKLQYLNISTDIVHLNQRESPPEYKSYKNDNTQVALGLCF